MAVVVKNKNLKGRMPVSELFQPTISEFAPKETESTQRRKFVFKDYIPIEENTQI